MNQNRVNSIKKTFPTERPDSTTLYTNQEIVNLSQQGLFKPMKEGIYEKVHAEYMRDKDVMIHISRLAEEYGLKETEAYKRFESNMNELGYTIGSFIKGIKGERTARKLLKLISFDKNVKILYNVALQDEDTQAEYDAIVIAPYGLFVVEVKNWDGEVHIDENGILTRNGTKVKYDLLGRMCVKEGILRECLGEIFPDKYQGILLLANENAEVQGDYKQMPVCCGGSIIYRIRAFDEGEEILTDSQIDEIAEKITSNHKEQRTVCKVNCEEIVEDYAFLMADIEEAAEGTYSFGEECENDKKETDEEAQEIVDMDDENLEVLTEENAIGDRKNKTIVGGAVGVLAGCGLGVGLGIGVLAAKMISRR